MSVDLSVEWHVTEREGEQVGAEFGMFFVFGFGWDFGDALLGLLIWLSHFRISGGFDNVGQSLILGLGAVEEVRAVAGRGGWRGCRDEMARAPLSAPYFSSLALHAEKKVYQSYILPFSYNDLNFSVESLSLQIGPEPVDIDIIPTAPVFHLPVVDNLSSDIHPRAAVLLLFKCF